MTEQTENEQEMRRLRRLLFIPEEEYSCLLYTSPSPRD